MPVSGLFMGQVVCVVRDSRGREGKGDDGVDVSAYICAAMFSLNSRSSEFFFPPAQVTVSSLLFSPLSGAEVFCYSLMCLGRGDIETGKETETEMEMEME